MPTFLQDFRKFQGMGSEILGFAPPSSLLIVLRFQDQNQHPALRSTKTHLCTGKDNAEQEPSSNTEQEPSSRPMHSVIRVTSSTKSHMQKHSTHGNIQVLQQCSIKKIHHRSHNHRHDLQLPLASPTKTDWPGGMTQQEQLNPKTQFGKKTHRNGTKQPPLIWRPTQCLHRLQQRAHTLWGKGKSHPLGS